MNDCKFKVGDLVFSIRDGWQKVINIQAEVVNTDSRDYHLNGNRFEHDVTPSLFTKEEALAKFPEFPPPKQKIKKSFWVNIYVYGGEFYCCNMWETKTQADRCASPDSICCKEIEIEVEV